MASSSVVPTRCCAAALLCSLAALWFCGCWWHPWTTSALHGLLPQQELPHASVKPGSQVPGRAAPLEASFWLEGLHPLRCEGRCITWGATEPGMNPGNKPGERQNSQRAFLRAPSRARRDGGNWYRNQWVTSEVLDEPQRAKTWHPSQREVPPRKKRLNIFRRNVRQLALELWQENQEHVPNHGFDLVSFQLTGWSFVTHWQQGGYESAHCGAQHEPAGGLLTTVKLSLAKEEDLSYCAVLPGGVQHVRDRLVKNCYDLLNVYQHPWRAGYSQYQNLERREATDHRPPLCSLPAEWQPWRRKPQCTKSSVAHQRKTHLNIDDQILMRGVLCGQWVFRFRDLLRHRMEKHNEATVRWQMYKRLIDVSPYVPCRWHTAWQPDHECLACVKEVIALDNFEDPFEGPAYEDAPFTLPLHEEDPQPRTSLADFLERTLAASPNPRNHAMASSARVIYPRWASLLGYANISSRLTRNRMTPGAMKVEPADENTKMAEAEETNQGTSDATDGTFKEQRLAGHRSHDNSLDWLRDSAAGSRTWWSKAGWGNWSREWQLIGDLRFLLAAGSPLPQNLFFYCRKISASSASCLVKFSQ